MDSSPDKMMLVTGGSGFLALHCIAQALAAGYRVKTTIRSASKQASIISAMSNAKPTVDTSKLTFITADLLKDDGWSEAVKDVELVLHVASPFPGVQPADENELIRPAVNGTLRVLRAARAAGTVKRVVVTSSNAAISYGTVHQPGKTYDESDWSDPAGKGSPISPYAKSKTLAEQAAWEFIKKEGGEMQLAVVNPVGIFGPPLLLPTESTTVGLIQQMLDGKVPAVPNVSFGLVDVRDVASLHLLVATKPEAAGKRFLCIAGKTCSLLQIAQFLKSGLGPKASKVPGRQLPDFLVRTLSYVVPQLKIVVPELGKQKEFSNAAARGLGWEPRSNEECIVSCGQALIDAGIC